jgi:hypothetical protein
MMMCSGCTYVGIAEASMQAGCMTAVSGGDETSCMDYLTLVQAAGFCK